MTELDISEPVRAGLNRYASEHGIDVEAALEKILHEWLAEKGYVNEPANAAREVEEGSTTEREAEQVQYPGYLEGDGGL